MTAFFDSNVVIYAYSIDARRDRALGIMAAGGAISAQVLNEVTSVLRNKQRQEWPIIEGILAVVKERCPMIVPLTAELHAAALTLARDHILAFYDALIVAAAIEAGCDTLWSEDMQHGQVIGRLTIRNPFLESAP